MIFLQLNSLKACIKLKKLCIFFITFWYPNKIYNWSNYLESLYDYTTQIWYFHLKAKNTFLDHSEVENKIKHFTTFELNESKVIKKIVSIR